MLENTKNTIFFNNLLLHFCISGTARKGRKRSRKKRGVGREAGKVVLESTKSKVKFLKGKINLISHVRSRSPRHKKAKKEKKSDKERGEESR